MTNICDARVNRLLTATPPHPQGETAALSDGRLLDQFIQLHDESAFEEIVRRHGLMVLGVCQRVLDNRHDAEDCFQAVFMVLMRKSATVVPREMVGNWLYGVAYRTALEARKLAARRRNLEKKKQAMPLPESNEDLWQELRPVLDHELSRLPDKYRFVLVACDLEGKTRSQVAGLLHVPEGTVASRLARARALLAKRLHRHRLILSPGLLASLLADHAAPPALPETLVANASRLSADPRGSLGASVLADTVIKAMLWTKLKLAGVALCVLALLGLGVAWLQPSPGVERKLEAVKVPAGPKKEKPRKFTECVLRKVDLKNQEIEADDASGAVRHVRLEPGAKVTIAGKEVKLSDLEAGMVVNIEMRRNADGQSLALSITALGQSITGQVKSMDGKTLTVQGENEAMVAEAITVDPEVVVTIAGAKRKLDDVKTGMPVTLQLSADADRARIIAIISPPRER